MKCNFEDLSFVYFRMGAATLRSICINTHCEDNVPSFVLKCVELINKNINTEELLRKEPVLTDVNNLETKIKNLKNNYKEIENTLVKYCTEISVHVIGSILKRFLRNLITPLLSNRTAMKIADKFGEETQNKLGNTFEIINVDEIVQSRCTLNKILAMAKNIEKSCFENKKKNKDFKGMNAFGLGRVLSQCFHRYVANPQGENILQPWLTHMIENYGITYAFCKGDKDAKKCEKDTFYLLL